MEAKVNAGQGKVRAVVPRDEKKKKKKKFSSTNIYVNLLISG